MTTKLIIIIQIYGVINSVVSFLKSFRINVSETVENRELILYFLKRFLVDYGSFALKIFSDFLELIWRSLNILNRFLSEEISGEFFENFKTNS